MENPAPPKPEAACSALTSRGEPCRGRPIRGSGAASLYHPHGGSATARPPVRRGTAVHCPGPGWEPLPRLGDAGI